MEYTKDEIGIDVSSRIIETVKGFPNEKESSGYHNHFEITLTTQYGSESFDFYGSVHDCEKGKKTMSDDDLKDALRCIIDDGIYGAMSFQEFCDELGYDEDSRRAEKIHSQCVESLGKLAGLGIVESDLYEIIDDLNE